LAVIIVVTCHRSLSINF